MMDAYHGVEADLLSRGWNLADVFLECVSSEFKVRGLFLYLGGLRSIVTLIACLAVLDIYRWLISS